MIGTLELGQLDYLLSRKEVDPSRIGITGRSGEVPQTASIGSPLMSE